MVEEQNEQHCVELDGLGLKSQRIYGYRLLDIGKQAGYGVVCVIRG
jgi:hypothetical protein